MRRLLARTVSASLLLQPFLIGEVSATVLYYPSQYATFNEAYNAAQPGDTIYIENFAPSYTAYDISKCLTLLGNSNNRPVLTDVQFRVNCPGGPDTCVLIKNLSFHVVHQAGVKVINNCVVDSCDFWGGVDLPYGVIDAYHNFVIRSCNIRENHSQSATSCSGIYAREGDNGIAIIEHNTIHNNTGGYGGAILENGSPGPVIKYNVMSNNSAERGGAICVYYGQPDSILHNTIVGNSASYGSAIYLQTTNPPDNAFLNNIIANNTGDFAVRNNWWGCYFGHCNDYWDNTGGQVAQTSGSCGSPDGVNDCIVADPLFCNAPADIFTLDTLSPCTNDPTCDLIGALIWSCSNVEYITTPSITGPSSGIPGAVLWFTAEDANSSQGHPLEYQFEWDFHQGPNDPSLWSSDNPKDNQWPLVGTYNVRVHARCQLHPERVSYWSEPHTVQIVDVPNVRPIAYIDEISPDIANAGVSILFSGHGVDQDGSVIGYEWSSSVDNVLSNQATFNSSTLSVGQHAISFRVQDDNTDWSVPDTGSLTILGLNKPPLAIIDMIVPNPATMGMTIKFAGHGTDVDGLVIGYSWRSSIDGQLSTELSFSTSTLSAGTHTIYFRVQDDAGNWSLEVTSPLLVNPDWTQHLMAKQTIIDYFDDEQFYLTAEQGAQDFLNDVQAHIANGTVMEKEIEALIRLLLVEEAAKAAYKSSDEIGAVPIAHLTARCTYKAGMALFLKLLFRALQWLVEPLKDLPVLNWFYNQVHNAAAWFDNTLKSINLAVVSEIAKRLTPAIMVQQGLSQPEAQAQAVKFGFEFVKKWEDKLSKLARDQLSESLMESKLTELNLWLYESGISIYVPPNPALNPLWVGATELVLESANDNTSNLDFQEGGTPAIENTIRNEKIPGIVASNTGFVDFINLAITAGDWAEVTELIILLVVLLGLGGALIASILFCTTGVGCVFSAITGAAIWGTLLHIQQLLSWAKIAVFTIGAGAGAFQLHANLPSQLWDTKHVAFDQAPRVLLGEASVAEMKQYLIPNTWSDSLGSACDSVASRLSVIRAQIEAADWAGVQGELTKLDSALVRLSSTSSVTSAIMSYSYLCNSSDTLEGVDSIMHYSMAHGTANDMALASAQIALGFAVVAEPDGADRDTVLMILDDCIGKLQAVGPAYDSAFADFDSLGFTVPPIVAITGYSVLEDELGRHLQSTAKNVSEAPVHQVFARLRVSDSSTIPITAESDSLIDILEPGGERSFRWHIEAAETDTLFQLELIIEPESLPGDFLGDTRIISLYYPTAVYRCCVGRVGDANQSGDDEPTIGDVTTMIDAKFIANTCDGILPCLEEADINQSAVGAATCDDVTIGDITTLIDYLFITGPSLVLPDCL